MIKFVYITLSLILFISPVFAQQEEIIQEKYVPFETRYRHPSFPGGEEHLLKFLSQNIRYPKDACNLGITGKVIINCIVNIRGEVEDAKIVRGIGRQCDEEVLRVVKSMPRWAPGGGNTRPGSALIVIPIYFVLSDYTSGTPLLEHDSIDASFAPQFDYQEVFDKQLPVIESTIVVSKNPNPPRIIQKMEPVMVVGYSSEK